MLTYSIVSPSRVVEYITKYATQCEPRSEKMKEIYTKILTDSSTALQLIQKLLVKGRGTCQILMLVFFYQWIA